MADPTNVTAVIAVEQVELFVAPSTVPGLVATGVRLLHPVAQSAARAA